METTLATVTKYPDSILAKMFMVEQDQEEDVLMMPQGDNNNIYNIDCDPDTFRIILTWLRLDVVAIPEDFDKKILIGTAKQLGLEKLVKELSEENNDEEVSVEKVAAMTDWLKLNVGGTIFETSRSTLTSDSESILSRMFQPNSNLPPATITDGVYQIDACPRSFEVVLNWLRYRTLIIGDTKVDDVFPVVDYFGLRDLRDLLEDHKEKEAEEKGKLITCIEESVEKIEEVLQHVECEISAINEKMEDFKIEMSSVATGMDDVWRLKCELANISGILTNGFKSLK